MKRLKAYIEAKPHHVLSIPAVLCFFQFIGDFYDILITWNINSTTINQLMRSADGFESVVLFIMMIILQRKKD